MTWFLILSFFVPSPQATSPASRGILDAVGIQVALDRAGFSSGVIDGRIGANTRRAVDAYRRQNATDPIPASKPLVDYRVTAADTAGPFVEQLEPTLLRRAQPVRVVEPSLRRRATRRTWWFA